MDVVREAGVEAPSANTVSASLFIARCLAGTAPGSASAQDNDRSWMRPAQQQRHMGFGRLSIVQRRRSIEKAQHLATSVLPARLLMVNNPSRGCEHDVSELARREQVVDPLLNVAQLQIETRGDNAALVDAASELHDDLAAAVVIDNLELANVACVGGKCAGPRRAARRLCQKLCSYRASA